MTYAPCCVCCHFPIRDPATAWVWLRMERPYEPGGAHRYLMLEVSHARRLCVPADLYPEWLSYQLEDGRATPRLDCVLTLELAALLARREPHADWTRARLAEAILALGPWRRAEEKRLKAWLDGVLREARTSEVPQPWRRAAGR